MGVISAIGNNLGENLNALRNAQTGIDSVQFLTTSHRDTLLGEVKHTNAMLKRMAGLAENSETDRTTLLGMLAASEALLNAGISDPSEMAFISSTTVGGMCYSELQFEAYLNKAHFTTFIDSHECAASTRAIAGNLGIKGFSDTLSTACSSSANAIMLACNLVKYGYCEQAIAGGTDALSLFTLNGFNTLMILDKEWCRPFDRSRAGLNLGEGAAYLVIESEQHARGRGADILAQVTGYCNSNDAYHQTASSPEGTGALLAMQGALRMSGLKKDEIGWINAHGTATPNNDLSESIAIQNLFGNNWPLFSSTKAFTGHTLAACGAIEAIYAVLGLRQQQIFPNLNFREPIEAFNRVPVTGITEVQNLRHVLSNSFGFGGNCSTLILSSYEN